jgi:uncharacterized protein
MSDQDSVRARVGSPSGGDEPAQRRVVTWDVEVSRGLETAWVTLGDGRLAGRGRAVGLDPEPYWLTYELETGDGYVTRRLTVEVESATYARRLDLVRGDDGIWTANGRVVDEVAGALDCDLGRSPLTNTMPILRHRLHQGPGAYNLVMAWVAVPELTVHRSEQGYTHLRPSGGGAIVEYAGSHRSFVGDLVIDPDGLVIDYPQLARRIS